MFFRIKNGLAFRPLTILNQEIFAQSYITYNIRIQELLFRILKYLGCKVKKVHGHKIEINLKIFIKNTEI